MPSAVDVRVVSGSSARICLPSGSLDAAVTDPPYHDDVQYAELSDIFRAWAGEGTGELIGDAVVRHRTRGTGDGTAAYQALLCGVFAEIARALRPGGHLVLSFANRHPSAWTALFSSLQSAGFRTVGYTVVHSENETDHAKVGRRACTLDVLLDLVVDDDSPIEGFTPRPGRTQEGRYCDFVGEWAMRIGTLKDGWSEAFIAELRETAFLAMPGRSR